MCTDLIEREIYSKGLSCVIMEPGKFKIFRVGCQAGHPGKNR